MPSYKTILIWRLLWSDEVLRCRHSGGRGELRAWEEGARIPLASPAAPRGTRRLRLQVPRLQWPWLQGLVHWHHLCFHGTLLGPLTPSSPLSSVRSPRCCPVLAFPVLFHFHPHFSTRYPGLSFSCFLFLFAIWRENCPRDPPSPPALEEKTGPRRQTLPLGRWKRAGWFFHHRSRTPKTVNYTHGSTEMSIRSLLLISTHSGWNILGASFNPPLNWNTSSTDAWKPTIEPVIPVC